MGGVQEGDSQPSTLTNHLLTVLILTISNLPVRATLPGNETTTEPATSTEPAFTSVPMNTGEDETSTTTSSPGPERILATVFLALGLCLMVGATIAVVVGFVIRARRQRLARNKPPAQLPTGHDINQAIRDSRDPLEDISEVAPPTEVREDPPELEHISLDVQPNPIGQTTPKTLPIVKELQAKLAKRKRASSDNESQIEDVEQDVDTNNSDGPEYLQIVPAEGFEGCGYVRMSGGSGRGHEQGSSTVNTGRQVPRRGDFVEPYWSGPEDPVTSLNTGGPDRPPAPLPGQNLYAPVYEKRNKRLFGQNPVDPKHYINVADEPRDKVKHFPVHPEPPREDSSRSTSPQKKVAPDTSEPQYYENVVFQGPGS